MQAVYSHVMAQQLSECCHTDKSAAASCPSALLQRGKKSYQDQDVAGDPLFSSVDAAIFQQRPTYSLFFALLDNYHAQTGTAEHFSQSENREMTEFLDAVCQTPCMQYVHNLLVSKARCCCRICMLLVVTGHSVNPGSSLPAATKL